MKQVLIRQGQAVIENVPAPMLEAGTILVQVDHSCISIGTEMSSVRATGLPLWQRALKQPQNVKKVFQMVATQGLSKTMSLVDGKISASQATGYSASGIVLDVGQGVVDIQPGDRVACAGAQCAHHAEIIRVPRNLTTLIPDGVDLSDASTVTIGAIALQGIRRALPTLGETFVVLGLGILGQLTAQMLRANGCRVIGIDVDRARIDLATQLGMNIGLHPEDGSDIQQVARLTDGHGADAVIITAASPSDSIISTAFQMTRKKGRVVLVGDVGLNLNRADFYAKEIDFYISSSYGPGRYDNNYEERGLDYPIAYVRWTENRNMAEYLRLIAESYVKVKPLIAATYTVEQATQAYETLKSEGTKPLMILLSYPRRSITGKAHKIYHTYASSNQKGKIRVAVAGAGVFAKGMHLPNLQGLDGEFEIRSIMSRTGHNAVATAKQFRAAYSTTNYDEILEDRDVDLVLIASRHNTHASMTLAALEAGKHVLVEKPLVLTEEELMLIERFYGDDTSAAKPIVLTGFNRRFSVYLSRIKALVEKRTNPMIINYQMNAGYIPLDHWVHSNEGGGRNIGEACHIYDIFTFLTDAKVVNVTAMSIRSKTNYYSSSDNFVVTMNFEDGSIATLTYTALGANEYPKEMMKVFCDGKVIVMDDYKKLTVFGGGPKSFSTPTQDKGQRDELISLATGLKNGIWPIPLWQQVQVSRIGLIVEEQLARNKQRQGDE
jgi:predicted dehydrogenase/threonine dehydrogenase-like Zn-dependent dehydrogenase